MIRLKNGFEIEYTKDFDQFFKNLLTAIISESRKDAEDEAQNENIKTSGHELFLKELMDNCIYVTHQLFQMSEKNRELAKFMVTGFLFNSIILNLPFSESDDSGEDDEETTLH